MIKLKLDGFKGAAAEIDKISKQMHADVKTALVDFATSVEREAKELAPADEGALRNSIHSDFDEATMTAAVTVTSDYAAFMEFGTRKFAAKYVATLPQDWKTYAATFKGKGGGGSFDEFIQNIMAWVRRKGIGGNTTASGNTSSSRDSLDKMQQAAYWIALNILQNGVRPQPFLYPAVRDNTPKLEAAIKKIFS